MRAIPLPNISKQTPGVMAQMFELVAAQGKAARVEEVNAQFNERDK